MNDERSNLRRRAGIIADRAEEVRAILDDVVQDIELAFRKNELSEGVSGGQGGGILLNHYLHEATGDQAFADNAERYLDAMLEATERMHPLLFYGGLPGAAWMLTHLAAGEGEEPDVSEFDEFICEYLEKPWQGSYDLVGGLVGIGFYGVERFPAEPGLRVLELTVERLGDLAVELPGGIAWHTPPDQLPPHQLERYPAGYHNLGLAHGVPGIIRLLAGAVEREVRADMAADLLERTVPWLLSHLEEDPLGWVLPGMSEDDNRQARRLAWCYNELGAMTSVLAAGRACRQAAWTDKATMVLRSTIGTPFEKSERVVDDCLCHGTAGIAHIYQVLADELDDEEFRAEAARWFDATLANRKPGQGCGGFEFFTRDDLKASPVMKPEPGFLEGATGIALALLSGVDGQQPGWNRILALS